MGGRADAPAAVAGSEAEGTPAPGGAAAAEAVVTEPGTSAPITPVGVAPAAQAEVPTGIPLTASAATSVQVLGPSVDPAASSAMVPTLTAVHLFALDDAAEWHKWQAVQGGIAHVQAALSSALGVLGNTVLPGSQGLWKHFNTERERTRDLSLQINAAKGVIRDLQGRERAALEEARRAEARLQAVTEKARLDLEEFQAIAERARRDAEELQAAAKRACRDAEELAQLRGEHEALSAETGHLRSQVQGLQSAMSRGADRERDLKAWADGEIAKMQGLLDAERGEHGALRDAPKKATASRKSATLSHTARLPHLVVGEAPPCNIEPPPSSSAGPNSD
ncbi:uncharacterized protein LOC101760708 [Setaria italica]|uniref:uncharacterized protein LOC101760708 n=1 Tax=Setaria italica TaxID=4555 RepID=UPI000648B786|nr:uncharacterized protein LOC101760708 [Setaria italica]